MDFGDSSGMDAFGGYGGDLGVSTPSSGAFDYFGTNYGGEGFGSLGGTFGVDNFGDGGMSLAQWATPGYKSAEVLGQDIDQSFAPDSNMYGPDTSSNALGGLSDDSSGFGKKAANVAMKTFMAALSAKNPALGFALQAALAGRSGRGGEMVGGRAGSMIGGGIAGPVGGYVGGQIGAAAGRGLDGRDQATGAGSAAVAGGFANPNTQGIGLGDIASLYAATRTNTTPFANTSSVNAGRDMSSIYGPTSQYATELRRQLERRDAASGRRSQYGPREVELMTKLSELEARQRNADSQTNLAERNQSYKEQVEAENRKRQRDAAMIRFLQGSGIATDIAGLF